MPDESAMVERQIAVTTSSRQKYGTPRAQVEAQLRQAWEVETKKAPPVKLKLPEPPVSPPPQSPPVIPVVSQTNTLPVAPPPTPQPLPEKKAPEVPVVNQPVNEPVIKQEARAEPAEPRELGKGGHQHRAIQHRIKKAAEELGFRADIEKPVLSGEGSADLWLAKDGQYIACEITITNSVDNE